MASVKSVKQLEDFSYSSEELLFFGKAQNFYRTPGNVVNVLALPSEKAR